MKPEQAALTSNAGQPLAPRRCCSRQAVDGKIRSGVVVPSTIRSSSDACDARRFQRARGGVEREVAGGLAFGGDVPLADAGARGDPLVAGVDELGAGRRWSAPSPAGSCRSRRCGKKSCCQRPGRKMLAGNCAACGLLTHVRPHAINACRSRSVSARLRGSKPRSGFAMRSRRVPATARGDQSSSTTLIFGAMTCLPR